MDKNKSFQELFKLYKSVYPDKKSGVLQNEVTTFWNSAKIENDFEDRVNTKLVELQNLCTNKKQKLMSFWSKVNISYFHIIIYLYR